MILIELLLIGIVIFAYYKFAESSGKKNIFATFVKSTKEGFQEVAEAKTLSTLDNFEYKKTELENKIRDAKVNHILHLILSIITAGIWIIVWILIAVSVSMEKSGYNRDLKKLYADKNKAKNIVFNRNLKAQFKQSSQTNISDKDKAELKELHELKGMGVITQSEYEDRKTKVLTKYE